MAPRLSGFDHVHVYVPSWHEAEAWYKKVLGFRRVDALMPWAVKGGPLTIEDADGNVHLALFEREDNSEFCSIAFGATAEEFMQWKGQLEIHGLKLRLTDHKLAYSLYFNDPWGNRYEITTYDHDDVVKKLK